MALPSGCIAGSPEGQRHYSTSWQAFVARGAPPIHFGREDGVECTLLRVACQSEPFLASPWQGDANIRALWHIGCQSEFDELVLMSFRPVYRGFCRRRCFSTPFHPVKGGFGRMGRVLTQFRPPKRLFRRMGNIVSREQLQKNTD